MVTNQTNGVVTCGTEVINVSNTTDIKFIKMINQNEETISTEEYKSWFESTVTHCPVVSYMLKLVYAGSRSKEVAQIYMSDENIVMSASKAAPF